VRACGLAESDPRIKASDPRVQRAPNRLSLPRGDEDPLGTLKGDVREPPFPSGETPFPRGETPLPRGEPPFPSGETPLPSGETPFPRGETPFPRGETPFPSGETRLPRNPSLSPPVNKSPVCWATIRTARLAVCLSGGEPLARSSFGGAQPPSPMCSTVEAGGEESGRRAVGRPLSGWQRWLIRRGRVG